MCWHGTTRLGGMSTTTTLAGSLVAMLDVQHNGQEESDDDKADISPGHGASVRQLWQNMHRGNEQKCAGCKCRKNGVTVETPSSNM